MINQKQDSQSSKRDRSQQIGLSAISWNFLAFGFLAFVLLSGGSNAVAMAASIAVPDEATATAEIDTAAEAVRVVLRLGDRKVFLYQGEQAIVSYPVAVGAAATPTPQGQFEVSKLVIEPIWQSPWTGEMHAPGPNSALGLRWIGFHTSESGSFGFHGTPTLDSIGKAVSNGCVRMRNEDIVALFSQVTIGTPVKVEP